MDNVKPRYTATITAQRGRNGHTQSNICMVSVDLSCLRLWAVRVNSAVQRLKICSLQVIPRVLEGRSSMPRSNTRRTRHIPPLRAQCRSDRAMEEDSDWQ